jgi:hypothetical protein
MIQDITPVKRKPASVGSKMNLTAMSACGGGAKNMDDHHARAKIMRHFSVLGPDRHSFTA